MHISTGFKLSLISYSAGVASAVIAAGCAWAFWLRKKFEIKKRGK